MNRRNFFKNTAAAGIGLSAAGSLPGSCKPVMDKNSAYIPVTPQIEAPKGAVYIPVKAFNTWQHWKNYKEAETERDFGYARLIGLNSLRIWLSYEYWLEDPKRHEECLEHMLQTADAKGIKILIALFDSCGVESTPESRSDTRLASAVAVMSPSRAISNDESRWNEPEKFVQWFLERYASNKRLLAIEIMNEPYFAHKRIAMTRYLMKSANRMKGSIPFTIGSLHDLENWANFLDLGLDILQYHENFPTRLSAFEAILYKCQQAQQLWQRPFWLTEWQRYRPGGSGWGGEKLPPEELMPNLASLAGKVNQSGLGNYFWSLMLKPAYLVPQRNIGTINGLFHEDGTVYSIEDARAVSQNPALKLEERREMPEIIKYKK
jgi:hypothetical protein